MSDLSATGEASELSEAPVEEAASTEPSSIEVEGDTAADYLEELLDIADVDGDIDIEIRNDRSYISIISEQPSASLDALVGEKGETLEALQELARLNVLSATGERSRLILDIADFRKKRAEALQQLAVETVAQVKAEQNEVHLDPMTSFERKIVHDHVAELGLLSESEGEGSGRHIVVRLA